MAPRNVVSTGRLGAMQGATLFFAWALLTFVPIAVALLQADLGLVAEVVGPVLLVLGLVGFLVAMAITMALAVSYGTVFFWAAFWLASRRATFAGIFRAGALVTFGTAVIGFVPSLLLAFVEASVPGSMEPVAALIERVLWLVTALYLVSMFSELTGLGVAASFYVFLAASFAALIGYLGISWLVGSAFPDLDLLLGSTDELE